MKKLKYPVRNPTLVFDEKSFYIKSKHGNYISLAAMTLLKKLSLEFNMIGVRPPKSKFKNLFGKITRKDGADDDDDFPGVIVEATKEKAEFLIKKYHSPLIFMDRLSEEYQTIRSSDCLPFSFSYQDMMSLLASYSVNKVTFETHARIGFDARRAYSRKQKRTKFESKFFE